MIANHKEFYTGVGMMAAFLVVLVLFFAPLYEGHNGFAYLDNLYNSISKGSANYLGMVNNTADGLKGTAFEVTLPADDASDAQVMTALLASAGAAVTPAEGGLLVKGDLGGVLAAVAEDVDAMYHNHGDTFTERRGVEARLGLYTWWKLLNKTEKQLQKQKLFAAAKDVASVVSRGVETAYNYYGVEPQSIMDRIGVVTFSLVFYVFYTLWYGFSILFMFEGWGLKLEH
ncbi:MAG: hypothetical protein AB7D51_01120 [Desulfovibrionaceae bacterium]